MLESHAQFRAGVETERESPDERLQAIAYAIRSGQKEQKILIDVSVDEIEGIPAIERGMKWQAFAGNEVLQLVVREVGLKLAAVAVMKDLCDQELV